jgi:hypothetical protein
MPTFPRWQPILPPFQHYLMFVQQSNSGNHCRSQGPKINCSYWNWIQGYKCLDEMIKYFVHTLNKYVCTTGRPESQVVQFSLGWSPDPDGMYCTLALFQDAKAWGNKSCWMLSLLFPTVRGSMGHPPRTIRSSTLDVNYILYLTRQGGWLANVGNLMGCSESQSFNSLTNQSTLSVGRADVW